MNYEKNYYDYISYVKTLNRKKYMGVYYEEHHIIPTCVNGENKKSNIVLLTAREHFLAHYLLMKIYKDSEYFYKICYAFIVMKRNNSQQNRYMNSRLYESAKEDFAKEVSKNRKGSVPWNKGTPCSENVKLAVSKANKGKTAWNKGESGPTSSKESNEKRSGSLQKYYSTHSSKLKGRTPWNKGSNKTTKKEKKEAKKQRRKIRQSLKILLRVK